MQGLVKTVVGLWTSGVTSRGRCRPPEEERQFAGWETSPRARRRQLFVRRHSIRRARSQRTHSLRPGSPGPVHGTATSNPAACWSSRTSACPLPFHLMWLRQPTGSQPKPRAGRPPGPDPAPAPHQDAFPYPPPVRRKSNILRDFVKCYVLLWSGGRWWIVMAVGPATAPPHASSRRRTIGVVRSGRVGALAPCHPPLVVWRRS